MKKAFIYCRVSTDEQAKHGWSIDGQASELRKYAKEKGYEVVKEYVDAGFSGSSIDRPDLLQMLDDLKSIEVDSLLVWRLDRISRDDSIYGYIKMELIRRSVQLISTTEQFDASPMGEFMEKLLVNLAKLESRILAVRTKLGMKRRLESGHWIGGAPLGYKYVKEDGKRIIAPDPSTAPYIKQLFQSYSTGKYSLYEVAELMKKRGFLSSVGKSFSNQRVKDILCNPFYVGKVAFTFYNYEMGKDMRRRKRKRQAIEERLLAEGKHKPIVEKYLFDKVQKVVAERGFDYSSRSKDFDFILRGILWCDDCGEKLTAERKLAKGINYYHCIYLRNKDRCRQPNTQTQDLESQVEEMLGELQIKPEKLKLFELVIKEVNDDLRKNIKEEKESIKTKLSSLEKRENRLVDELSDKLMSKPDFQRHYVRVKDERETLERRMNEIDDSYIANVETIARYVSLASKVIDMWGYFDVKNKKLLLRTIFKRLYVRDKKILWDKAKMTPVFEWIAKPSALSLQKSSKQKGKLPREDSNL